MKAMYFDSCLLKFCHKLILLQSIAKCCRSLASDFVVTQAVQVQITKVMHLDSCLLQFSQSLILLQSIAKCCCSLVSDFVAPQAVQVTNYESNVL